MSGVGGDTNTLEFESRRGQQIGREIVAIYRGHGELQWREALRLGQKMFLAPW
jgi:hypothetical protein